MKRPKKRGNNSNRTITRRTNFNQFAFFFRRKVIESRSRQNMVLDSEAYSGRLRDHPCWEGGAHRFAGGFVWDIVMLFGA